MGHIPEYGTTGRKHPYHLVNPSPWPLLSSFAAGFLALMAIFYFHDKEIFGFKTGLYGIYAGLAAVLACMFFWWKDVVYEAVVEKAHTSVAEIGLRYGMILFIASEVMFFVAFFWAYFDAALFFDEAAQFLRLDYTGAQWPPAGWYVINPLDLPFLMTLILLLSGCTTTWAHAAIVQGKQDEFIQALGLTVLLGFIFLGFQVYEYIHAPFGFTEGVFASTFFMATGFHGFHVLVGTIFLAVCYFRALKGHFTKEKHFGFEAAAWYWHFVDVVWLFLFVAIYFWGAGDAPYAAH